MEIRCKQRQAAQNGRAMMLVLALLFFALPLSFAATSDNQYKMPTSAISATAVAQKMDFTEAQVSVPVDLAAQNPTGQVYELLLMRPEGDQLVEVQRIATLMPNSRSDIVFDIDTSYTPSTNVKRQFVLVSQDSQGTQAFVEKFFVDEDWVKYESTVKKSLLDAYGSILPVFLLAFLALCMIVGYFVKKHSSESENAGEFTLKTLLLPIFTKDEGILEKLSVIFQNPLFWVEEIICVLVLIVFMNSALAQLHDDQLSAYILVFGGMAAAVLPFLYLLAAYFVDFKFAHKPFRFFISFFLWGCFSAVAAFFINSLAGGALLDVNSLQGGAANTVLLTAVFTPIIEEIIKSFGIYFGSRHHGFDSAATGLLLGFATGLGFSFIENWFYFTSKTSPFDLGFSGWVFLIAYRSFFNSIAHGIFSGAFGGFIGYLKSHPTFQKNYHWGVWPGILLAIMLHSLFNSSAILDMLAVSNYNVPVFIFNPSLALIFQVAFIIVLLLATRELGRIYFYRNQYQVYHDKKRGMDFTYLKNVGANPEYVADACVIRKPVAGPQARKGSRPKTKSPRTIKLENIARVVAEANRQGALKGKAK